MLCCVFPQRSEEDFRVKNARVLCRLQSSLANANVSGFYLFFKPNPSIPSSYLRSARLSPATSALGYTPGTSALGRLENSLRTSSFRYFNSGDALRKKTSKPRIRAEMLDSWKDVEGIIKACLTFLKSSELS